MFISKFGHRDYMDLLIPEYKVILKKEQNKDDTFYFELELPGVKKQDVTITTKHSIVKIEAKNKRGADKQWNFTREIIMPKSVDMSTIDAELMDGILKISVKEKNPEQQMYKKIVVK